MVQFVVKPKSMYSDPDKKLSYLACKVPFIHIEIHTHGQVSACCHTWLPVWVGNVLQESPQQVVDNVERLRIQNNMREGNFSDCNDQCPQLASILNGGDKHWAIIDRIKLDEALKHSTIEIGFSYDQSCNLQCPSCRNNLIVWDPEDITDVNGQRIRQIHDNVKDIISILLSKGHSVNLNITGSGDAFASPLYWNYLLELAGRELSDKIRVNLKTNGVMMTLENLEKIRNLWPYIGFIEVSIDAATEETYKIVRKNGNFKRLKKNLVDFDNLVTQKCFPSLNGWQSNIVVQKDNYKELKEFVEWQLTFKSKPRIWTNLLARWYHMDDANFNRMAIWQDTHPERSQLVEILRDPVFHNSQIDLGNMSALVPKNE